MRRSWLYPRNQIPGETGPADSAAITGKIVPALMEILKSNKRYENNVTHEKLPETVGSALRSLAAGESFRNRMST